MVQEQTEYRTPAKDMDIDAVLAEIEELKDDSEEEC